MQMVRLISFKDYHRYAETAEQLVFNILVKTKGGCATKEQISELDYHYRLQLEKMKTWESHVELQRNLYHQGLDQKVFYNL